jgi:hypothetical protein
MTTPPLGTATVELAETICEVVVQLVMAAVTASGVSQTSPAPFDMTIITTLAVVGFAEKSTVGFASPDCQSRYQQATLTDPVPLPELTDPSVNSVNLVQPAGEVTCAVMAKSFHRANRNMRSPAWGVAGMVTAPSAVSSAHDPVTRKETAMRGYSLFRLG